MKKSELRKMIKEELLNQSIDYKKKILQYLEHYVNLPKNKIFKDKKELINALYDNVEITKTMIMIINRLQSLRLSSGGALNPDLDLFNLYWKEFKSATYRFIYDSNIGSQWDKMHSKLNKTLDTISYRMFKHI